MTGAHPVFGFMGVSLPPLSLSLLATRHLLLGYSTVPGCGVQGPYAAHTAHWRKPEKQDERLTRQTHCAEAKWLVKMTMLMKEREISSSRVTREGYLKESSFSWTSEGRQDPGKRGRALGGGEGRRRRQSLGWSFWQEESQWLFVRSGATAWRKEVMVLMTWAGSMKTMCPQEGRLSQPRNV